MRAERIVACLVLFFSAACATAPEAPQKTVKTPVAPAAPVFLRADLEGANIRKLNDLLGEPALTRREGNGEYRRYALTACTLIVILYPDELGVAKVAHMDATATSSNVEKPDLDTCLATG